MNQVVFDGLDGVAILNANLFTSSADAVRIEPFLLSVVDCIWNCIAGNDSAEQKFLASRGVLTLLSMLEVPPPPPHSSPLRTTEMASSRVFARCAPPLCAPPCSAA